jgi:hypothetical protein
MLRVSLTDEDAGLLRELLDAKLVDLRREISHTDSPRFRETLYRVDAMITGVLAQLPQTSSVEPGGPR